MTPPINIIEAIFLGLVQGLTEFIPVSSSGHLLLAEKLLNLQVGGLFFDVMLHAGTLLALVVYFWKDLIILAVAMFTSKQDRLWRHVLVATIPAVVLGFLLQGFAENQLRSIYIVIFNLAFVGAIMIWVDKLAGKKNLSQITTSNALLVGLAQALSLIPGVSRSGITMVAGVAQGFSRETAAHFAFLMAIPVTFGAVIKLLADGGVADVTTSISVLVTGIVFSAVSGYLAIRWLLAFLSKHGLKVFGYYRIALAVIVLLVTLL